MNPPKILIVDDDDSIRKFVQVNLEARGFTVFQAKDGEEGVRLAEQVKPDLFILDIVMPGMDGFGVCRKIRQWSQAPVIMLSAREGENDRENSNFCGANDYITKPFVLAELLSQTKRLLSST
jgi:DNA-binding response OmpR family regulator